MLELWIVGLAMVVIGLVCAGHLFLAVAAVGFCLVLTSLRGD